MKEYEAYALRMNIYNEYLIAVTAAPQNTLGYPVWNPQNVAMGEHGVIPADVPPPPFPPPMDRPGEHEVILTPARSSAYIGQMLPPPPKASS
eukprot:6707737-Heterocapsa_arctica.AAC.1